MLAVIGILAIVMVIGYFVMSVGYNIFDGALRLILGIVGLFILMFAFIGCMGGL